MGFSRLYHDVVYTQTSQKGISSSADFVKTKRHIHLLKQLAEAADKSTQKHIPRSCFGGILPYIRQKSKTFQATGRGQDNLAKLRH